MSGSTRCVDRNAFGALNTLCAAHADQPSHKTPWAALLKGFLKGSFLKEQFPLFVVVFILLFSPREYCMKTISVVKYAIFCHISRFTLGLLMILFI